MTRSRQEIALANYFFTSSALLVALTGASQLMKVEPLGKGLGMFSSDQIVEQFQHGTATKESLATLFQAELKPNGDGFSLVPLPPDIKSVTIIPYAEHLGSHPKIESIRVTFSSSSQISLKQVQPSQCKQWTRVPYVHGEAPFLYLCAVGSSSTGRVKVFAGMTNDMESQEGELSSLLFVH